MVRDGKHNELRLGERGGSEKWEDADEMMMMVRRGGGAGKWQLATDGEAEKHN